MKELTVEMAGGRSAFAPGEEIAGTVTWDYAEAPRSIDIRLFWYTEGRGSQDVHIEVETELSDPGARGSQAFTFEAPAEPYSFSGSLITLAWALEVVGNEGFTERVDMVIAPGGEEVRV